jgi:hypothetical protein
VFGIGEVDVVQMLDEVVATVERPLCFRFGSTLLVLVRCHVGIVGMHLTTEWARLQRCILGVAAYPGCSKGVYGVFMPDPFVLGLEGSRTEGAKERQVLLRLPSTIDTVDRASVR